MLFLVDRHSSLLVGICMECIKERYMPVLLSSISLFGKALFYTQFGMASMHIFQRLFNIAHSTPRLYDFLYNCSYTIIVNPGYTLVDIPQLLTDEKLRRKLVTNVTNLHVHSFWDYYNHLMASEQREMSESILNKIDELTLDPIARNIIGQ